MLSGRQSGECGLEALPSEGFLQHPAPFGIQRGDLGHRYNRGIFLHALHPFLERSLLPFGLLLGRLSHVVLAVFVEHCAVRRRKTCLRAKLLQLRVGRRRDNETEAAARQYLARYAEQTQSRERDEIENDRALGFESRYRICESVIAGYAHRTESASDVARSNSASQGPFPNFAPYMLRVIAVVL